MHELSIAEAILKLARFHLPLSCALKRVCVIAGPMRAIDPDAMEFAWQSIVEDAGFGAIKLDLELRPWTLQCPLCRHQWISADLESACECGGRNAAPVGGDELQLTSIEVDEIPKGAVSCASQS